MKEEFYGVTTTDDKSNFHVNELAEPTRPLMTQEEAKKWIKIFEIWHDRFIIDNGLDKRNEL